MVMDTHCSLGTDEGLAAYNPALEPCERDNSSYIIQSVGSESSASLWLADESLAFPVVLLKEGLSTDVWWNLILQSFLKHNKMMNPSRKSSGLCMYMATCDGIDLIILTET